MMMTMKVTVIMMMMIATVMMMMMVTMMMMVMMMMVLVLVLVVVIMMVKMMMMEMMMMMVRGRDVVDVEKDEDDEFEDDAEEEGQSQDRETHFVQACAVESHTDISQEAFCAEIFQGKCQTLIPGPGFCASLRARHVTFGGEIFREIARKFAGMMPDATPGENFLRARAVEMQTVEIQMDMSQEAFCAEIYREDAGC